MRVGTAELVERLWARDAGLWTGRDEGRWLGWLDEPLRMRARVADLRAFAEGPAGFDVETTFGLGFWPASPFAPMGGQRAFGHYGAGGSVGFADPEHRVAGGYVMSRMGPGIPEDPRPNAPSRPSHARSRGEAFIATGNTRPDEPVKTSCPSPRAQSCTVGVASGGATSGGGAQTSGSMVLAWKETRPASRVSSSWQTATWRVAMLRPSRTRSTTTPSALPGIPAAGPGALDFPPGCRFHPRCPRATDRCRSEVPLPVRRGPQHVVACHHPEGVA